VSQVEQTGLKQHYVDIAFKAPSDELWDLAEAQSVIKNGYTTGLSDTFVRACKQLHLRFEFHNIYRMWLIHTQKNLYGGPLTTEDLPMEKNDYGTVPKLPPHLFLPYPSGSKWREMKNNQHSNENLHVEAMHVQATTGDIRRQLVRQAETYNLTRQVHFKINRATVIAMHCDATALEAKGTSKKQKKKRTKAAQTGKQVPQSVREALESDKPMKWIAAMNDEIDGLTDSGVLLHDQSYQDLTKAGIHSKPVPLGMYFDEKLNKMGEIEREKARAAIQGHRGNMQKGVHFFETFAATPQEESIRILAILTIKLNLKRRAYDIVKAYCWATIPQAERIALRYPEGYKRSKDGKELFMILLKNLYGDPAAARRFTLQRDEALIKDFSQAGWVVKRLYMDPCFFHFTKEGERVFAVIHSDDIKAAGSSDEIMEAFSEQAAKIWKLKITDPSWALGLEEALEVDEEGRNVSIIHKMPTFIRGMAEAFKDYLPTKEVTSPYPPKSPLNKDSIATEKEIAELLERGQRTAVGMLLWSIRRVFDEQKFGISMLCSVMSKPNAMAWDNAMHMIKWQIQNADRGVRWHRDGNQDPIGFVDASNKTLVLSLGTMQAGLALMWLNGPLCTQSMRLHHMGLSSEHNEYMAITNIAKKLVWLRQLLAELGLPILLPTPVYGDNIQANKLCMEHFISTGNQYILTQYHFNKEKVADGTMTIIWLQTVDMLADIYTKAVDAPTSKRLTPFITGFHDGFQEIFDRTKVILEEKMNNSKK
jgi:hypothetical protein